MKKLTRESLRKLILQEMMGDGSGVSNEQYLIDQIVDMCKIEGFKCDASESLAVIKLPTGSSGGEAFTRLAIEVADDLSVEIELDLKDASIDKLQKLVYAIQSAI